MTYSIIAHDPHTHQHGIAVQTCNLAVGMWVPWAEGGVGAVATQAMAERSYGTLGLDLMRGGLPAPQALAALLAADEGRETRQVAIIDAQGRVAQFMGARCLPMAGMACGEGFAVQANMMGRDTVWGAMAAAFEAARQAAQGDLADWMLAALEAAQAEGGDMRGQQTAALMVVGPGATGQGASSKGQGVDGLGLDRRVPLIDLRVDHHPQAVAEMRRLLGLQRAYDAEYKVGELAAQGAHEEAYALLHKVLAWAPGEDYLRYLCAVHLAGHLQRMEEALALLGPLVQRRPIWLDYLRRDMAANVFGAPGATAALYEAFMAEGYK